MLDGAMRKVIDPPLNWIGRGLARAGVNANMVTLAGLALGLAAAGAIALESYLWGLGLIAGSRVLDGLDGAVARATQKTDFGGFLDIVADFAFYGAIPLGFVVADPAQNGVAGAFLLASFYFNGATFLGYSVLAERRGMESQSRGAKSLYFTGGLLEGTETIAFFGVICVFPALFWWLAALFGAASVFTGCSRVLHAWQVFGRQEQDRQT